MKKLPKRNIVTIWWWTGSYVLLNGLKNYSSDNITAIIWVTDEWWSTGFLRDQYKILPPGDIRQAVIALSNENQQLLRELFGFRFEWGELHGHNFGNIFLTALEQMTGDFQKAIDAMGDILDVSWKILPVTLDKPRLVAVMKWEKNITWEENLDEIKDSDNIDYIKYDKKAALNPKVKTAIQEADIIIVGPGSLYTSIITNLLVDDIKEEIINSKAKKVLISNITNSPNDSKWFYGLDFMKKIEEYLVKDVFDYIILPENNLTPEQIERYAKAEGKYFMDYNLDNYKNRKTKPIVADIIDNKEIEIASNDMVKNRSLLRYNSEKLAKLIISKIIREI